MNEITYLLLLTINTVCVDNSTNIGLIITHNSEKITTFAAKYIGIVCKTLETLPLLPT